MADGASAMDTGQESVAPGTVDSERMRGVSECVTRGSL